MPRAQLRHGTRRTLDLLAGGHQRGAVPECPAVILHMRDLDTVCSQCEREIDDIADPVDVGAVHHCVHRERELMPNDRGGERPFPGECARVAGNAIGGLGVAVLDRDLHMIKPGLHQPSQHAFRDPDGRGDEIGIQTRRMSAGSDIDEIAPRAGLATRQMHLQHAQFSRFAQYTQPSRGIELVLSRIERERVRAIGAAERAAMG